MVDTVSVASVIDSIAANTLNYALLLAAIGTLAMAFIEMLKGVLSLRQIFHRKQVREWVSDSSTLNELLVLAAGGRGYADVLYGQATERMMGQIQAAANLSLEYPDRYPHTYTFFTKEDLEMKSLQASGAPSDSKVWAGFAIQSAQPKALDEKAAEPDSRAAQQARVRLGNLIARRLDTFQNRTQFRWARLNQAASIIVGAALSAYALIPAGAMEGKDAFAVFALSLLAGMLAPFAKDVVTAVSGIRTKA